MALGRGGDSVSSQKPCPAGSRGRDGSGMSIRSRGVTCDAALQFGHGSLVCERELVSIVNLGAVPKIGNAPDSTLSFAIDMPETNPFRGSRFLLSAARLRQLPDDLQAEVAFSGRSNSGKSTALNVLCDARALARVSKTPGRTQLINLFEVPRGGRLVDLPGYGYARVPEATRRQWGILVGGYIESRANLRALVLVMDTRRPLTPLDREMLCWAHARGKPVHIMLTKADKISKSAAQSALAEVRRDVAQYAGETSVQLFSGLNKIGLSAARAAVAEKLGLDM